MAAACVVFPSALVDLTFIMGWNIHSSLLLFSFGLHEDVGFCITDEGALRFAGLRVFLSHCKDAQQDFKLQKDFAKKKFYYLEDLLSICLPPVFPPVN